MREKVEVNFPLFECCSFFVSELKVLRHELRVRVPIKLEEVGSRYFWKGAFCCRARDLA